MAQVTALLKRIAALTVSIKPIVSSSAFNQILLIARQSNLSEYDASYVELAVREGTNGTKARAERLKLGQ
jgi:predicted nucleic acid-binding protein